MTYDNSDCLVVFDGNNGRPCTKCKVFKSYDEFGPNPKGPLGLHSWCRVCVAQKSREYRANNREKLKARDKAYYKEKKHIWAREYNLFKRYGITLEWWNDKVTAQGNRCIICDAKPEGKGNRYRLHLDHNHDTGENRDLLCANCNLAVGNVRENPEIARKVADYLERWGK